MRWLKIVAVQGVIALLLIEAAFRVYNPLPFRVRGDEIVLPVGRRYIIENPPSGKLDPVTLHSKNSLGFRGPDPPPDFASRLTILTVGGSTTECLYLSDGKTWSDVMAAHLAPRLPGVWVNNAGLDGHSSFGHLILLKTIVARMRPTVVLFLVGANEIGRDSLNGFDAYALPGGGWAGWLSAAAARSEAASVLLNLIRAGRARRSGVGHVALNVATHKQLSMTEAEVQANVGVFSRFLPGYDSRLTELATVSRANGIEPVFLTQPALFGDARDRTTGVDLALLQGNGNRNGHAEWRLLEGYNDVMRAVAARLGVFLIDLAHRVPKDSRYYYDFLHLSNDGGRIAGEIVAAELGPHLVR